MELQGGIPNRFTGLVGIFAHFHHENIILRSSSPSLLKVDASLAVVLVINLEITFLVPHECLGRVQYVILLKLKFVIFEYIRYSNMKISEYGYSTNGHSLRPRAL